jgi:transcriptional regulator with GAF, ATPase, and Fis domain
MDAMVKVGGSDQRVVARSVVLTSANAGLRQRVLDELTGQRWTVREAQGGADAMAQVEKIRPEVLLVDDWLPDLEATEFCMQMASLYPAMEVLRLDGTAAGPAADRAADAAARTGAAGRSPRRSELLLALRAIQDLALGQASAANRETIPSRLLRREEQGHGQPDGQRDGLRADGSALSLPELIGESRLMRELAKLIQQVAPRSATVLIEGETGTGKELVAKAVHRLSARAGRSYTVLNCAAIPESLLEAELFGHTRGAFTGAVQSRTGRIEAADGGTLLLDEIGEMPLALQAKMLRFLECGELQRVGDNETMRVDVRVIAATHQDLEARSAAGTFRLDLYHRLAVFPLEVPALRERLDDLPLLVEFFLEQMGRELPRKVVSDAALERLASYSWPGNVRELKHVLERGAILAGDYPMIGPDEIRWKLRHRW